MTARVIEKPLAIAFVFSNGTRYTLNLHYLPCSMLVRDLAQCLAAMAHPHGEVDAQGTADQYRAAIGQLSRALDMTGFTGGAEKLTRARLIEFWLAHRPDVEQKSRFLLRNLDEQRPGLLRPEVSQYLAGPPLRGLPKRQPLRPFSSTEWDRLRHCCEAIIEEALADQRAALALAETGQDPRVGGWPVMANRLWLLLHRGPMSYNEVHFYLDITVRAVGEGGSPTEAARRLFPTMRVVIAFRMLLGMTCGIVPDGLEDLGLDDIDWAGNMTMLLEYVKGRTRRESLNLPAEAVRVLRRWLEYSAYMRPFVADSARSALWIVCYGGKGGIQAGIPSLNRTTIRNWARGQELRGDDGQPLSLHRHRIRTTFAQRHDKSAWTGRTTIDPNHSAKVEGDHYLTPVTPAQIDALATVIEEAQADLVRKARTPMVLSSEDAAEAAEQLPEKIAHLALSDEVIQELVGGEQDVFTAACTDQLAGLHGPKGRPCPARPWVCLLCPLAVFAPRHAENLLRLKAFFARQFRLMTVPQFLAVFGPYAHRLDTDILPKFAPAVLAAAATEVSDRDDELPLRPAGNHRMTARHVRRARIERSPFAGQYVHELLDLDIDPAGSRPRFDDEVWDLRGVRDTPVQIHPSALVWDFSEITQPHWQLLVREFVVALRAPHHELIAQLPWARRGQLSLRTCAQRRFDAVAWLRWLSDEGFEHLSELTQQDCDRWLQQRRADGLAPLSRMNAILTVKDLARYTELFTTDHYPDGFMPWPGKTAAQVAELKRTGENSTPPIPDLMQRRAVHAALYLVEVIGPHAATAAEQLAAHRAKPISKRIPPEGEYAELLADYLARGEPLPELDHHEVRERLQAGWDRDDPLLPVNFIELVRDLGTQQFYAPQIERFRTLTEAAVARVGVSPRWVRDAALVERANGDGQIPWSDPLTTAEVDDLLLIVFNAALFLTAAITGMRSSELMELTSESCLPPEQVMAGLERFRLAGLLIKGQQWGGVREEWVVIEPAYRSVELAIRLTRAKIGLASRASRDSLFGRYNLARRFRSFRRWVNGPVGARLGLEPIPDGEITGRMTRRSLSLEMAQRPHGLWAAKVHMKQVSVSTAEGYAARPGGAQSRLHAEMKREEQTHKLALTKAAYQAYRAGQLPAGPGARTLIAAFEHVDAELAKLENAPATVVATDRHIELLLKKRAATLHIQPANYCWFTDPAKALCLKLAGTPTADQPLAGLCDAARCPQATFHTKHREVWAAAARTTETFLGNPRIPAGEKHRLASEHDRAQRVLTAIDQATTEEHQ